MMVIILFFCFTFAMGMNVPEGIPICHKSDPNLGDCMAKSIETSLKFLAQGNKELGLPVLEPMFVKDMEIGGSTGKSVSLQQKYHNVKVHGMTNSKIKVLNIDLEKGCSWRMNISSPTIRLEGEYEMQGQVLVFPMNAKGKCNVTQYNLHNVHTVTCERYTKKGQTYMRLTNYTLDMKLEDIHYEFTDLFPGNQQISDEILKTLNDNGLAIFNEIKAGFESVFGYMEMQTHNNIMSKFTEDQLFPQ
ncbi:unnamed protein product [Phaedon cochleariae]|uniref:Uncharacterized protein n=1 Tax=Phaedon cochleariae TaxID=80249 RepID=A0A9P0DAI6_PHACE|nr:unnamed protein product [Phaedon cochleariae]